MTKNTSGNMITTEDPDEFPIMIGCWYCGEQLIWQNDFMKEDWGIEGEGMVTVLLCSGCGAEVRMIEAEEE